MRHLAIKISLVSILLLLSGCGGWRAGYFSMPYFGNNIPSTPTTPATPYQQGKMQHLYFQSISLHIDLMNDVQTSDTAWAGVVVPLVPLKMDLKNKWRSSWRYHYWQVDENEKYYCLVISVNPKIEGVTLYPWKLLLSINGVFYTAQKVSDISKAKPKSNEATLIKGKTRTLKICFEAQKPNPGQEIRFYVDEAIYHPDLKSIPVINFHKKAWREPYS